MRGVRCDVKASAHTAQYIRIGGSVCQYRQIKALTEDPSFREKIERDQQECLCLYPR